MTALVRSLLFLSLICVSVVFSASPPAGSVNVADYGAKGDGSDATSAIQNAIKSSSTGQTVWFPTGVYTISSTITLGGGRTYQGDQGALLTMIKLGSGGRIFTGVDGDANDITIESLIFEAGEVYFPAWSTPVTSLKINNCIFQNNSNNCSEPLDNCPAPRGLFIDGGLGLSNSVIDSNSFFNIISWWVNLTITTGDVVGVGMYAADDVIISNNRFDLVNQGIKIYESGTYVCNDLRFVSNYFTRIHRIAIENQCGKGNNTIYDGNYISEWVEPNWNSYGISARADGNLNIYIINNVILGWEKPAGWYAYGIESHASDTLIVTGNYVYGVFSTAITFCTPESGNLNVTNNFVCGSVQWAQGDIVPQYSGCVPPPPNGAIKPNTDLQSCDGAPALPPVPNAGAITYTHRHPYE